jgi:hypothetical protein
MAAVDVVFRVTPLCAELCPGRAAAAEVIQEVMLVKVTGSVAARFGNIWVKEVG